MNLKAWEQELATVMPFVLEARRDLHRHPEVGGEEQWTRAYLEKALQDMGIPTQRFEGTCGVMAQVEGMRPGPCLGIRADIDGCRGGGDGAALRFRDSGTDACLRP